MRLNHACHAFLLRCFMFDHACCLPHSAKQNGLRNIAFLFRRGSRSPVARSRIVDMVIELCRFTSGLYVSLWRSRRVTETWGTELRGGRGWRRGACASLRNRIGLAMLSAGSTLGQNAEAALRASVIIGIAATHKIHLASVLFAEEHRILSYIYIIVYSNG